MTEQISIPFDQGTLEGIFNDSMADKDEKTVHGAIITHPHPEYGGNMHNGVVMTIEEAYRASGYTTLRFNFRGTGRSGGSYDSFLDMCDDVTAAYQFMKEKGIETIALAGYSFGSWVNSHVDSNGDPDTFRAYQTASNSEKGISPTQESPPIHKPYQRFSHQILISPPVTFMDFSDVDGFSGDSFVVYGDRDEFAPMNALESHLKRWNVTSWECIQGCDHFYSGRLGRLRDILTQAIGRLSV